MTTGKIVGECFFLDVGQGTSQVIVLADKSAIVIDCGPNSKVLVDLLKHRLNTTRIHAVVLSHNHADHIGGLSGLVRNFRKAIDKIYLLQDQLADDLILRKAISFVKMQADLGNCPLPTALYRDNSPHILYKSLDPDNPLVLELLYPTMFENLAAQTTKDQNRSSAILLLRCGNGRILFSGDAQIDAWDSIYKSRKGKPLEIGVASISHHGGQVIRQKHGAETESEFYSSIESDFLRLYTDIIRCQFGIVSVGTEFKHEHPIPPHIKAVRDSGACVMCTQITERCCSDLESLRPGILDENGIPRSSNRKTVKTAKGQSKAIACAGTVLVQIGENDIEVLRHDEHQKAVSIKLSHPMCRSSSTSSPTAS